MNEKFLKEFSENIKRIRKTKKLTQVTLAARSGLSHSYICDLEAGDANPTLTTLQKLAAGLDITIIDLFSFLPEEISDQEVRQRLIHIIEDTDPRSLKTFYEIMRTVFKS